MQNWRDQYDELNVILTEHGMNMTVESVQETMRMTVTDEDGNVLVDHGYVEDVAELVDQIKSK